MKNIYRKELFLYINGIVVIPTLKTMLELNILQYMKTVDSFSLDDIIKRFKVNPGYINISLRTLLSINLLYQDNKEEQKFHIDKENIKCIFDFEQKIKNCTDLNNYFIKFNTMIYNNLEPDVETINIFKECDYIFNQFKINEHNNEFEKNLFRYLIGSIVGPIMSNIGFINKGINDFKVQNRELNSIILSIFNHLRLIDNNLNLTEKGCFFNERLASFGVTTSYLPLLNNLKNLLTTNANFINQIDDNGDEIHVNRRMNVWGSGGAHKYYFKKIDDIIVKIFNKKIEEQPKGIIDIGCGDGTFLKHCYDLITSKTIRKNYLKEHPIMLLGIDINKAARIATRNKLNEANIDNIILHGNISDPDSINKTLFNEYKVNLEDFINTRTFLDHNRVYSNPKEIKFNKVFSCGAFAFKGKLIKDKYLLNNLIEHLSKWKKYVHKHGLIILELHTIDPNITANNQNNLLSCSYDATHGYSDQYLVEYEIFIECANLANMKLYKESYLFPNNENPTISINYFI